MRFVILFGLVTFGCSSSTTPEGVARNDTDAGVAADTALDGASADMGAAEVADAAGDDAPDAPDAARTPESLCKGGSPRLEWKDGKCYDHAFASDAGLLPPCAFLLADDGPLRCLPEPHGTIVGSVPMDCASVTGPRLLDQPPPFTDRALGASVMQADGRYTAHTAEAWAVGGWSRVVAGTSVCETTGAPEAFPYANASGFGVRVFFPALPSSMFYAAPK